MTRDEFIAEVLAEVNAKNFPAREQDVRDYAEAAYYYCRRMGVKKMRPKLTAKRFMENIMSRTGGASVEGCAVLSKALKQQEKMR